VYDVRALLLTIRSLVTYPYAPTNTAAPNKEAALMYTTDAATYNKLCATYNKLYYGKESLKRYVDVIARFFRRVMNSNAMSMTVENNNIIHRLSRCNHITELEEVLDNLDDIASIINATNSKGNTGLHIACNFGYREIVMLLIEHGANTSITNKYGRTPYECAMFNNHSMTLQLLTLVGADIMTRTRPIRIRPLMPPRPSYQLERTYFNFNK